VSHSRIVTEAQLDEWVRGNPEKAQGAIVELVYRLVAVSSSNPKELRFPLGDSITQPGPDGFVNAVLGFDPFVPEGKSFWDIGTGQKARRKATHDYSERVRQTPKAMRSESAFVFVTPRSGARDWPYTWKKEAQGSWLEKRRRRRDWRDVRVIDASGLIHWLHHFPGVEVWLAGVIGLPVKQIETPEHRWEELRTIGDPLPLTPEVFLVNRDEACNKLKEVFSGTTLRLRLNTHFPDEVVDFVSAYVATMDEDTRIETVGRCLLVSGPDAWNYLTQQRERHILVADFDLSDADATGTRLLQRAHRAGHAAIFGGRPGGIPDPNRVLIPSPKSYQLKEVLERAGYKEERARTLAQKSNGNLTSLLRCVQNLSLMPEWAQGTDAAELAIAQLLGSWNEKSEDDRSVVDGLSGKAYGEWIGEMCKIALRPATPLIQRDGVWKVVARYEAWHALGPNISDEHLNRLRDAAVQVLREVDPKFDLQPEERYAAAIHGKVLAHSYHLRNGLAETLALLGSYPLALTSCSLGKAEATAVLSVRAILSGADWVRWASLNDLLPLLAEAAPGEFLDAVDNSLRQEPCPFDTIFSEEGSGIMGSNYMTGLLWSLETLAWEPDYLNRVLITLGELAARDPGGNWANRPANSLSTILLPWFPQTCAPIAKRKDAVTTLMNELPEVAWDLLLSLLPQSHRISSGSRKPAWRAMIPEDWTRGVSQRAYWEQIAMYAQLAVDAAKKDTSKLEDLVDRLDDLPPPAHHQVLAHLGSDAIVSMPESEGLSVWTKLVDLVSKHRKFADAQWAMKPEQVDNIAAVAERLAPAAPTLMHQRLFSDRDFDLYEEKGDYRQQERQLEERRKAALVQVFKTGGSEAVLEFAQAVESPWRVGVTFGAVAPGEADTAILPRMLDVEKKSLAQLGGGFVVGRFAIRGWDWVDAVDTSQWTPDQKGQFLAYLPFDPQTWDRCSRLLAQDESPYWTRTSANPYATEGSLETAVDRLLLHGRPNAAIGCLARMLHNKAPLDAQQAVRALFAAVDSLESAHAMRVHNTLEVLNALQREPSVNPDDLARVEWAYLPLLEHNLGASPKLLESTLANDPGFFCQVIRAVFRSQSEKPSPAEPTKAEKTMAANAYSLLSGWKIPPGTQQDGTFDGDALSAWLGEVKKACSVSGHLGIALTMVGHVLVYVPPDPDGLWIHRGAAAELNGKDVDDMREGFRTQLYNSRGGHEYTAGRQEREIAQGYRKRAEEVESAGYHRLATTLRDLALSYEREADRDASRDPFGD